MHAFKRAIFVALLTFYLVDAAPPRSSHKTSELLQLRLDALKTHAAPQEVSIVVDPSTDLAPQNLEVAIHLAHQLYSTMLEYGLDHSWLLATALQTLETSIIPAAVLPPGVTGSWGGSYVVDGAIGLPSQYVPGTHFQAHFNGHYTFQIYLGYSI